MSLTPLVKLEQTDHREVNRVQVARGKTPLGTEEGPGSTLRCVASTQIPQVPRLSSSQLTQNIPVFVPISLLPVKPFSPRLSAQIVLLEMKGRNVFEIVQQHSNI